MIQIEDRRNHLRSRVPFRRFRLCPSLDHRVKSQIAQQLSGLYGEVILFRARWHVELFA